MNNVRNKIISKRESKNPFIIESDKEADSNHSSDHEIEDEKNSKINNNDVNKTNINEAYVYSTNDLSKIGGEINKTDKKDDEIEKL